MIPYMSIVHRIIAWLLWHFEGFDSVESAEFDVIHHPELLKCASLLRDYWYIKNAELYKGEECNA